MSTRYQPSLQGELTMSANEVTSADSSRPTAIAVSNLPSDINEESLKSSFASILKTEIHSITLVHDKITGQFKNLAFVDVGSFDKVKEAIRMTNGTMIKGNRILVAMAIRPFVPSHEKNIYLKNVPASFDNVQLYDMLSNYGELVSMKLPYDERENKHLGYAFATYMTEDEAQTAIRAINDMVTSPDSLRAEQYEPPNLRKGNWKDVFVKLFPQSWTSEELGKVFSKFGELENVHVQVASGVSQKFGVVTFKKHEDAVVAVGMDGKPIKYSDNEEPITLYISKHQSKEERSFYLKKLHLERTRERHIETAQRNLVVQNLSPYVTNKSLKALFERYGTVLSAKVVPHPKDPDMCSGMGYVLYATVESAQKAIRELNGDAVGGRVLSVSLFKSKAERDAEKRGQPLSPAYTLSPNALALSRNLQLDKSASVDERKQKIGNYLYQHYLRYFSNPPNLMEQILGVILGSLEVPDLLELAVDDQHFLTYAEDAKNLLMRQ